MDKRSSVEVLRERVVRLEKPKPARPEPINRNEILKKLEEAGKTFPSVTSSTAHS